MRDYKCYVYHFEKKELVQNGNESCWAGLSCNFKKYIKNSGYVIIDLYIKTKEYIYIDKFIEEEISDNIRKRIVYLINKITPCKFTKINNVTYIQYKLLKNHYSNLLLLNFIRILWHKNRSFDNENFFIDICKPKTKGLDYLEFMMTCIKNNVLLNGSFGYGDHSFVYENIVPKTKELLLKHTAHSMQEFLKYKINN